MKTKPHNHRAGMALIVALIFISVGLMVVGSLTARMMNQRLVVGQFELHNDCFQGLESALVRSRVGLENGKSGAVGVVEGWAPVFDANNNLLLPAFDSADASPASSPHMPQVEYMAYAVAWAQDGRDSNGDGDVDDIDEGNMYTIYARAHQGDIERNLEAVYEGTDVNVWRNAIFAGKGQIGGVISGNSSIHGSVHILGEHLADGGTAMSALDLTGSSLIHNNYAELDSALLAAIPALPLVSFEGQEIESLNAKLRVKRGMVSMSGYSEIGQANDVDVAVKETMDATFVSDGWTGNSVQEDGDRGDPTKVYSDNGWDEPYDLADKVPFPMLSDAWRNRDGTGIINPATGTAYTHEEYFSEVLLASPTSPSDGVFSGNMLLRTDGDSVYWNATQNQLILGTAANTATPKAGDDYLKFNSSTDVLLVNGQLRIDGDLTFLPKGSQDSIHYSGSASLLVGGLVRIDTSLLTCNNGVVTDTARSFPLNALGIMTPNKMIVGSTSKLSIMGAFYSESEIQTSMQTNVIGSIVSAYFNMGSNVPHIYEVPALADQLPPGMIGDYPIFSLAALSWRELGVQ